MSKILFRSFGSEDFDSALANVDERRLPWPGGIKQDFEKLDIQEKKFDETILKNKTIEAYKYLFEKIAELKFGFGEFLNNREIINRSPYLIYLYAFLILFIFGIGIGFLRNNFKKSIQDDSVEVKPLTVVVNNQKDREKDISKEIEENPINKLNSNTEKSKATNSSKYEELSVASPSLEEIRNLINTWLIKKSDYLAGKSEININKIVRKG